MANPCRNFFVGTTLLLLFTGMAAAYTALQIQLECNTCDVKAVGAIAAYRTEYGNWNTAVDGARYHCGRFEQAVACYTECLHDTVYTYTSETKELMIQLYAIACDPSCYTTVLPYCYLSTVGSNDVLKSCTGSRINQDLDRCIKRELFVNQDCNSVCTVAQRFNSFNYFATILLCSIPYDTAPVCFSWAVSCNEKIFGTSAVDFTLYSNRTLIGSNQLACSHFVNDYDTCLQMAVSGNVTIGAYPYSVTYHSPCTSFTEELRSLVDYIRNVLVSPLCENPSATLNDTCQANATRRTTTATNTGIRSTVSAGYTSQQIQQECQSCDTRVLAAINTYWTDFGRWSKAIDGAKYHCQRFATVRSCYTDCLHGTSYTYSSSVKTLFEQQYSEVCDPVCYLAVLPYCYTSTVGTYDLTRSCDGANMNQGLKRCVETELFVKQNCTGACTQGQRKALFYYFSTTFQCTVPYQTANDCFTWTLYCSESIFGYNGQAYVKYVNQTIIGSNRLACSYYGDAYLDCVQQAIDGDVVLGSPPYTVTYHSPCANLTKELRFLADFDYGFLVAPFCENPHQSFNDTCQAYAAPTTVTASSQHTLTTHAVVTSRATPATAFPNPRATSKALPTTSSRSSSVAVSPSTVAKTSVSTMPKPFASLEIAYRQIILHSGAASVAVARSATVAASLAFVELLWVAV